MKREKWVLCRCFLVGRWGCLRRLLWSVFLIEAKDHWEVWTQHRRLLPREKPNRFYTIQLMTDGSIVSELGRNLRESKLDMEADDEMGLETGPVDIPVKKRFASTKTDDLTALELGAKAKNTHRQTGWGVRIFKGMF